MLWRKMQQPEGDPIARILNTILALAIQDGSRQIRIETREHIPIPGVPEPPGFTTGLDVIVFYLLDEQWKEQFTLPHYVRVELWDEIRKRAAMDETQDKGEIKIDFRDESVGFHLTLRVAVEIVADETTTLHLRFLHPDLDLLQ